MKRYQRPAILTILILTIAAFFACGLLLFGKKTENVNELINISELSEDFMDNYFKEVSEINSDPENNNILIAIANSKIQESYGANKIIEAPNNQYILQYNSEEEKQLALEKLQENSDILSIGENTVYETEEVEYNSWGITKMALDYAINTTNPNTGNLQQATAAIIDTGCDMALFNKYYSGKISESYNVLKQSTTIMSDEDGHGTHIAGTIAEGTPDNVKVFPVKVSNSGSMSILNIIAAINYIVYNNKAQVINMSFGTYYYDDSLEQAIESAKQNNIISVAAAGNDNTSKKHYPSSFDNTISISSVDSNLHKSTFSNYGAEVNFTAPGTAIKSIMGKDTAISERSHNADGDDDHETISGTSMATPHAVAAVAMLKGYNNNLSFENVIDILKENAQDLGEEGWDQYYGNGLISFNNTQFCDGTNCDDKYGVYEDVNKNIAGIEISELIFTGYNYYSTTNIMGSKVSITYTDSTVKETTIDKLPNVEIINYDPTASGSQTITLKVGSLTTTTQLTNPTNYESGWEYTTSANNEIIINGYKNHNLEITKLYVPETIDSKQVVAFADDFKFAESGNDIDHYTYLYLPSTFARIGDYSLSGTNIKYVYGTSAGLEIGSHAFESSQIIIFDIPITKVESYAFKDCFELLTVEIIGKDSYPYGQLPEIGEYAFYNCKKLSRITNTKYDTVYVDKIGKYAFYNCVALAEIQFIPIESIEEYAFYNTFLLFNPDLGLVESIGEYAFFESGIAAIEYSHWLETISASAFENCKNLKEVELGAKRIESRAFWGSGVEKISVSSRIEYISEDAFAYAPVKSSLGDSASGNYTSESSIGIIDTTTNKLIVGFINATGISNINIPDYVTEIGDYAFTGNNNLKKIKIPANVTKIGDHAFEDCYQLSTVYMLGSTITFGDNTFKKTYEGEIENAVLDIYVYKDSAIKQLVQDKNLNYKHIDPDEIIVSNYENTYTALGQVDWQNLSVKLVYHEKEDREETITVYTPRVTNGPISNGLALIIAYQDNTLGKFQYGDTHFIVEVRNSLGYLSTKNVDVTVEKIIPTFEVPTGITAELGQTLSEIALPANFEWMDSTQKVNKTGEVSYKAKFIPEDTNNYATVEDIDIILSVTTNKTIITPEITINDKTYDETTTIPTSSIIVSNLETSEYDIVSATSSDANVGNRTATVKLRLTNEKFISYSFDDGEQEKEFTVDFTIVPKDINLVMTDNSGDRTVIFDNSSHTIIFSIECPFNTTVKYKDAEGEYTLSQIPEYTEAGEYAIGYKLYIDDNYTEYYGEHKLTILTDAIIEFDKDINVEGDNFIVKLEDRFSDIANKIHTTPSDNTIEHRDKDDSLVNSDVMKTGDKIKIVVEGHEQEYIVSVISDTDGNGIIEKADYLNIKNDIMGITKLFGAYKKAADMNNNGEVDIIDYIRIKKKVMGGNL